MFKRVEGPGWAVLRPLVLTGSGEAVVVFGEVNGTRFASVAPYFYASDCGDNRRLLGNLLSWLLGVEPAEGPGVLDWGSVAVRDLGLVRARLLEELEALGEEVNKTVAELEALRGELAGLREERDRLLGELNETMAELERLRGEVSRLGAERNKTIEEVSRLLAELERLRGELEGAAARAGEGAPRWPWELALSGGLAALGYLAAVATGRRLPRRGRGRG